MFNGVVPGLTFVKTAVEVGVDKLTVLDDVVVGVAAPGLTRYTVSADQALFRQPKFVANVRLVVKSRTF